VGRVRTPAHGRPHASDERLRFQSWTTFTMRTPRGSRFAEPWTGRDVQLRVLIEWFSPPVRHERATVIRRQPNRAPGGFTAVRTLLVGPRTGIRPGARCNLQAPLGGDHFAEGSGSRGRAQAIWSRYSSGLSRSSMSASSKSSSTSQPSPNGSSLTSSGWSSRASLTAVTSPPTGA